MVSASNLLDARPQASHQVGAEEGTVIGVLRQALLPSDGQARSNTALTISPTVLSLRSASILIRLCSSGSTSIDSRFVSPASGCLGAGGPFLAMAADSFLCRSYYVKIIDWTTSTLLFGSP
jgi:hypothetical protein